MNLRSAWVSVAVIAVSLGAASPAVATEPKLEGFQSDLGFLVMAEQNCSIDVELPSSVQKQKVTKEIFKFTSNSDWDVAIAIERLEADDCVKYIEPNRRIERLSEPNDNYYTNEDMWGMGGVSETAVRNSPSSTSAYGANAIGAWDLGYTGSSDVVVAVIDEGFDLDHPDLKNNLWVNPGETLNGQDSDGNGVIDDIHGYDACYDDGDPDSDDVNEFHGTHVAGTIGAEGNNTYGVVGVNWDVSLMSIKIIDNSGTCGTQADLLRAYDYVIDMKNRGVNIVVTNNSYGVQEVYFSQIEQSRINAMGDAGVLFVGAAGNSAQNNEDGFGTPSSYECSSENRDWDCIIAVGSSEKDGSYSNFSNFGETTVDIAAPGRGILSTTTPFGSGPDTDSYVEMDFPENSFTYGYEYLSGTSMAAPHVAGAVALCASVNPTLDPGQIRTAILSNAQVLPELSTKVATSGILDVGAAVSDCATKPGGVDGAVYLQSISLDTPTTDGFEVTWEPVPSHQAAAVDSLTMQIKTSAETSYSNVPASIGSLAMQTNSAEPSFSNMSSPDCSGELSVSGGTCTLTGLSELTAYDVLLKASNSVGETEQKSIFATTLAGSSKTPQYIPLSELEDTTGPLTIQLPATSSAGLEVNYQATGSCEIQSGNSLVLVDVGTCTATANQTGDETYEAAAIVIRSFEVTGTTQPQTITFPAIADQQAPGSITLNATASSSLPVFYSESGDCTLENSTISFSSAGSCSINASQPGNDLFDPATPVTRSFNISSAPAPAPPSGGGGGGGGAVGSAPELIEPPELSGINDEGKQLSATVGEWDADDYEFSFQWYRCDEKLTSPTQLQVLIGCDLIQGATGSEYLVTTADENRHLLVSVAASEGFYSTTAFSNTIAPGDSKGELSQSPPSDAATSTGFWTKRNGDNVKIYAKNIIGMGKVQFFVNGQEIAWIRAGTRSDPKLRVITEGHMTGASYLVRDKDLLAGKNVFEIYVDGERVERRIASK